MLTRMLNKSLILMLLVLTSPVTLAGFATYTKDWPDDAATVDEKVSAPPANNEVTVSNDCVSKDSALQEKRISEQKRLYAKFGAAFVTEQLRKIQNVSTSSLSSAVLANNTVKQDSLTWEAGLGTKIDTFRFELSYLYEKNLTYNPSPLFIGLSETLVSTIKNQDIWLAVLWDLDKAKIPYFKPYFGGLVGLIWNQTSSTFSGGITNGVEENHSRIVVGWGAVVGFRVAFWTRWFGYLEYKYLDQGMLRWKSNGGTAQLKGYSIVPGINIGVQYLLG